jgi:hypothetical protein
MMMAKTIGILGVVVALSAGCKKGGDGGGGGKTYTNESPKFRVSHPADLKVGKVKNDGDTANLSIASEDFSRELFLLWAPIGSQYDPYGAWGRYGHEDDHVKTLDEGTLPDNGKYLVNDRGGRIYIHAVITAGDHGVLCMASTPTKGGDMKLLDACKTLASK